VGTERYRALAVGELLRGRVRGRRECERRDNYRNECNAPQPAPLHLMLVEGAGLGVTKLFEWLAERVPVEVFV
jgi:hypothetical protein